MQNAPLRAKEIGARSFALFTGSSNRWTSKPISEEVAEAFKENCRLGGFVADFILPHDNFLINLGSPDPAKLHMSRKSFLEEMQRCERLGLTMLNFHPGSHLNQIQPEECLDRIAESVNKTLEQTSGVMAVLESTAGQGSNLGHQFSQLAHIIDKIEDKTRIGVCVDTCHTYSAGYDLADEDGYRKTWQEFDEVIGAGYLKAIHLNDDLKNSDPESTGTPKSAKALSECRSSVGLSTTRASTICPSFSRLPILTSGMRKSRCSIACRTNETLKYKLIHTYKNGKN